MEKYAWKARVVKGKEGEYEKRHAEIWEEMKAVLKSAGIKTILYGARAKSYSATTNVKKARNTPRKFSAKAKWWRDGTST